MRRDVSTLLDCSTIAFALPQNLKNDDAKTSFAPFFSISYEEIDSEMSGGNADEICGGFAPQSS